MTALPQIDFFGKKVSRLICGGNPLSGFSHLSSELDADMIRYYTMPNIMKLFAECERNGINTLQSRGDRHQMRAVMEYRQSGGTIQWIAQTASEFRDIPANIAEIARYDPIAIYHHGTHTDNSWHTGKIDEVLSIVKTIKDKGLPAGVGTHIPDVVKYIEDKGWPVDFYMCCFYNLSRGYKSAPAVAQDAYANDRFPPNDPAMMGEVIRATNKPCLGFKIMAASRNCSTPKSTRDALATGYDLIKPTDAIVVGMFQKHKNQVEENAGFVREILL